jgi:signal transduction histidine kinase
MRSLRWRLVLAFAVLAAGVSSAIGVAVYQVSNRDLLDRARIKAVQSAEQSARTYDRLDYLLRGSARGSNAAIPPALKLAVAQGKIATFKTTSNGQPLIWAGTPSAKARAGIYVRESYAGEAATLRSLRHTLVLTGLAATGGAALLGLALASRLSLRLRRAAAAAERVTAGDLGARVQASGRDEVAALGEAMDRMAESLQTRLEAEQRFVANVAHDLRTPLTGLIAAASLLDSDDVAVVVKERASRLHALVEDLLEISRLENGAATADLRMVDLEGFVRSVTDRHAAVAVSPRGSPGAVMTDPRRLERVLDNLLHNAARHGTPPIEVLVGPGRIVVTDRGPGFSEEMLRQATARFTTGDPSRGGGIGLGLAIAAAQTRVLGGRLELANATSGGARITVRLPRRTPTSPGTAPA